MTSSTSFDVTCYSVLSGIWFYPYKVHMDPRNNVCMFVSLFGHSTSCVTKNHLDTCSSCLICVDVRDAVCLLKVVALNVVWWKRAPAVSRQLLTYRLVGLVVKTSASRAEDPRFKSRLCQDFSGIESYQ